MLWVVGTWLIASLLGLGSGHNTLFEGYDLSLSGYHLCTITEPVKHVISYTTSYTQSRACGGWLPWRMCDVTVYKTAYRTEDSGFKQVPKCCHGYEQVGSYCALSLNRSAEFTSKPGLCPLGGRKESQRVPLRIYVNSSGSECKWDIDCPQWQKCCQTENIFLCSDPLPLANRSKCLNVTITVKTAYEVITMIKGLFNHTRLLHSVVTGALNADEISVYHGRSWSAGPFTTSSLLLVCSSEDLSLEDISRRLYHLLENIEEVTNVVVQGHKTHTNITLRGDVTSGPDQSSHPSTPSKSHPTPTCDFIPKIASLFSYNVTTSSCYVAWATNNQTGVTFHLVLLQEATVLKSWNVTTFSYMITDLRPGDLYTVRVTPLACGSEGSHKELRVRTEGEMLRASARLMNVEFTEALSDLNSKEYKEFCQNVTNEIHSSLPENIRALVDSGKVIILIKSLSSGSVVVHFTIVFLPSSHLDILSVSSVLMDSLRNSEKYNVEINSTVIEDVNECSLNQTDCSPWASCKNTFGSYTCDCLNGYTDLNPSRQGRSCEVSPSSSPQESSTTSSSNPRNLHLTPAPITSLLSTSASTTTHAVIVADSTNTTPAYITNTTLGSEARNNTAATSHVLGVTTTPVQSNTTASQPSPTPQINGRALPVNSTSNSITFTTVQMLEMTTNENPTTPRLPTSTISSEVHSSTFSISITNSIGVQCRPDFISVLVRRNFLQAKNISENSLFLSQPKCGLSGGNLTHVVLTAHWNESCTTLHYNGTHTTAKVTLFNNISASLNVLHVSSLAVPIICTYPSSINVSAGSSSTASSPTGYLISIIEGIVEGSGSYQVTVRLLNGTSPLPGNYSLSPQDAVIVEVGVNTTIPQIKVIISKCWASSTSDSSMLSNNVFLENGCPKETKYTTVLQNGNDTVSLLSVQIFSLVNLSVIYMHCQIQICVEGQNNTCTPPCMMKTYRTPNVIGETSASLGPLHRSLTTSLQNTYTTLQTVGFVLLGVGLCLLVLALIGGLLCYKRKIGVYNFNIKPQQENFTYHVFDS